MDRNRLRFPSRLITYKYLLIGAGVVGAGVVGDGGRIKPHFFILFYSLNWGRSNFYFSLRLLFVSGLMLKVIVFLGIQP